MLKERLIKVKEFGVYPKEGCSLWQCFTRSQPEQKSSPEWPNFCSVYQIQDYPHSDTSQLWNRVLKFTKIKILH